MKIYCDKDFIDIYSLFLCEDIDITRDLTFNEKEFILLSNDILYKEFMNKAKYSICDVSANIQVQDYCDYVCSINHEDAFKSILFRFFYNKYRKIYHEEYIHEKAIRS